MLSEEVLSKATNGLAHQEEVRPESYDLVYQDLRRKTIIGTIVAVMIITDIIMFVIVIVIVITRRMECRNRTQKPKQRATV